MKKLYLVDVSSMFFRAFFALPHLTNDQGLPTNALYGFMNMTLKLLRDLKPEYLAFCMDSKEPSFRHEIYADYKANRDEMPAELVPQMPYIRRISEVLGIPVVEKPGFEADDLIGTLTKRALQEHCEVVIVSGDKDFAQLVGPKVVMYDTMKDVRYNPDGVREKWGVGPEQMIDYLALVGDSSDNVPGVKGIGPKGAQKLLGEFGTVAGIYENLDKISGKALKANLEAGQDSARLSQKLVTIHTDVPMDVKLEDLRPKPVHRAELKALLEELSFKNMVKQFGLDGEASGAGSVIVTDPQPTSANKLEVPGRAARSAVPGQALKWREADWQVEELQREVEPYSEVWGILSERGVYIGAGGRFGRINCDPHLAGEILGRKLLKWRGFDLKSLWSALRIKDPVASWDHMLAAYVIEAGNVGDFSEVLKKFAGATLSDLPTPMEMLSAHFELESVLRAELKRVDGERVLVELELPLVPVLYAMESRGFRLDLEELQTQSRALVTDIKRLEAQIFSHAGGSFNIASPKQLAEVLFEKLKLTPSRRTKTGYSTDSDVLEKLIVDHPIAQLLIDYREVTKLKSTYVDALPALINPETGRVHTHFNQAGTSTGRLSSQNPNLQNIPIRTERGRLVRRAFIPAAGFSLISSDYSQIELRLLAHISGDEGLIRAFTAGQDIHAATAAEVFGVSLSEVTPELRRRAKAINFGIAYGQGAFGLADTLGIPRGEAAEIIERYFGRFRRVREYMQSTVEAAKEKGFVMTMFGRKRHLPELQSKNMAVRKFGERAAINAPIQGSASDLVKVAMIRAHQDVASPMLLQVHDELLFEAEKSIAAEEAALVQKVMEGAAQLAVPLVVNVGTGANWADVH